MRATTAVWGPAARACAIDWKKKAAKARGIASGPKLDGRDGLGGLKSRLPETYRPCIAGKRLGIYSVRRRARGMGGPPMLRGHPRHLPM
jgi:hypothetical protein